MLPQRALFTIATVLFLTSVVTAQDCSLLMNANLTVQSSPSPSLPGQSVSITAFVESTNDGPDPTGTIDLMQGAVDLGTFPIKLGQVSTSTVINQAGAQSIIAIYSGDSNYCGSIVRYGQPVNRFITTIAVTPSAATTVYGQPVTFNVQLGPAPPVGVSAPTGQVEFFEGSTDLGGVAITTGNPSFSLATLTAGSHLITAVFGGDTNYYLVRSTPVAVTVNRAQTTTVLSSTYNSGQVQLTATVSISPPGGGLPGGTVQFVDATNNTVLGTGGLPAGAGGAGVSLSASIFVNVSLMAASTGHPITAIYGGDVDSAGSTSNPIVVPALMNATGAPAASFAAEELVSLFGSKLATTTLQSSTVPLPTSLGGYSVSVTDSALTVRSAGLYLVSPGQINFVIPPGTATGPALVQVVNAGAAAGTGVIPLQIPMVFVAPGLFSAGANGKGLAAAQIVRVHADGTQSLENVSSAPISFDSDTLYLVLYASGVRNRSSLANVTCMINGLSLPATFAGPQGQYPGLDQVDVLLPASLKGAGQVNISLIVDGQTSNTVTLAFQ